MSEKITLITIFTGLIAAFITAGGAGFLNLIILEKLDCIRLHSDEDKEKNFFILLFSVLNFALFLTLMGGLKVNNISIETLSTRTVIISILLTILISILASFTILPLIAKLSWWGINAIRTKIMKTSEVSNWSPKEKVFMRNQPAQLYIYTLDQTFISKGFLIHWGSERIENGEMVLTPPNNNENVDIEYVRNMFVEYDSEDESMAPRHFIDSNNNLQYFIFYQ